MLDTSALLRQLSEASGISGYEHAVRAIVAEAMAPRAHEQRTDALGNLIALRKGEPAPGTPRRSIMLAAHTDEIGLMVTGYQDSFLRFGRVGGIDRRTIVGQEVVVHGRQPLVGIIASHPPHVQTEADRGKPYAWEELYIDVGHDAARLPELTQVGDLVTFRREYLELAEGYVSGKAFDDRAGVVSLVVCLDALTMLRHTWDVYAVATSQEEVGLRGATVAAFGVAPDLAIAVDVGFGAQKGVAEHESIAMDGGPSIAIGPNIHPVLHERLIATANQFEIKHQIEIAAGATGTDAWAIQVTRQGIPTALLSIPLRYMHTSVETACLRDIERTGRLMAQFIAGLDEALATSLGL